MMKRMIVNAPDGTQQVVRIEQSGGYFDAARVVWNEWADGDLPADFGTNAPGALQLGGLVRVEAEGVTSLQADAPAREAAVVAALTAKIAEVIRSIDADVDAITDEVIGRRQSEYEKAEADALVFQAAGYVGAVPPYVDDYWQVMQAAAGWTAQQACDDILATAAAWRGAQAAMRSNRLGAKASIRALQAQAAAIAAEVGAVGELVDAHAEEALEPWKAFVGAIRVQLGIGAG